jgi:hypothetical protein
MRAALLLTLIASAALAQPRVFDRACDFSSRRSSRGGVACGRSTPTFQFAPSNGAGMGTVCSGAAITGSKGEAIAFTRAGPRSCMKGSETTGIANGDLVILSSNQPAVQPGGDGTGSLGLSRWEPRTNSVCYSQDLTHAPWTSFGDFTPTVTGNFAVAPDLTTTATRIQFAATSAAQRTMRYIDNTTTGVVPCPVGIDSASCFFKGNGTSGTLDMQVADGANGWTGRIGGCSFNSSTWTRCLMEAFQVSNTGGGVLFAVGNLSSTNGGTARAANDVLVWGCQCELGITASPYIPTTSAAVTRAAETATASYSASGNSVSLGGTYVAPTTWPDTDAVVSVSFNASNETNLSPLGAKLRCDFNIANSHSYLYGLGNALTPAATAGACSYSSGSRSTCFGSTCKPASGSLTLPSGAATLYIGGLADGGSVNGTVKGICADPLATMCRPASASTAACPLTTSESQTVAMIGDSIMVGASTIRMVDEVNDRICLSGRAAVSFAVGGAQIDSGANNCTLQYTGNVQGHSYRAVLTNCGINNILNGESGATAWGKAQTLLNQIVSDGFVPVVGNLTPCAGYATCSDAAVATFNSSLATWCGTHPTAICIDNNTLLGTGSTTLTFSPARGSQLGSLCLPSTDYLHPNNYCTTKLAQAFADASPRRYVTARPAFRPPRRHWRREASAFANAAR